MDHDISIHLVADVGIKVAMFDEDMRQATEWVELAEDVYGDGITQCLIARFKTPKYISTIKYGVLWDEHMGLMQPHDLDCIMKIFPGNAPIEYRIMWTKYPMPNSIPMRKL